VYSCSSTLAIAFPVSTKTIMMGNVVEVTPTGHGNEVPTMSDGEGHVLSGGEL
jgi:hypothetical protein